MTFLPPQDVPDAAFFDRLAGLAQLLSSEGQTALVAALKETAADIDRKKDELTAAERTLADREAEHNKAVTGHSADVEALEQSRRALSKFENDLKQRERLVLAGEQKIKENASREASLIAEQAEVERIKQDYSTRLAKLVSLATEGNLSK